MSKRQSIDFDDILVELGELGRYQIFTYILICLPVLFAGANSLSYVFTAGVPNYRCFVPECENPLETSYDEPFVQWAIPKKIDDNQVIGVNTDNCKRYLPTNNSSINGTCTEDMFSNVIQTCSEWVFEEGERTIVNDWNITCVDNQWKISLVGSSHFAGIIVGSCIFGILADRYGRKTIFVVCIIIMSISGALQVFAPEYVTFVVLIFVNALGTSGVYPLAFILGVEMVGKRKREITGIVLNYFYALGEAVISPIAWYTRDWISIQLIVSVPAVIFIVYYWIIPESIRWLLANKRRAQAKTIVFKAAKFNRVILSDSIKDSFKEDAPLTNKFEQIDDIVEDDDKILPVIKDMIRSRKLVIRFIIVYFIWGVSAFVFYGLSVNSTSLGGNKYVNFALVCLIEIPGYSLAWICMQKLGRKPSLIGSLLLCGITSTLTIFANSSSGNWAVITLFLMGKMGVTSGFAVLYVHTSEMLPTIIRSGGVGTASTVARVGALLAPFVPLLGLYYTPLPMIIIGVLGILAGLLAFKLPETHGIKLPETVEEAEQL